MSQNCIQFYPFVQMVPNLNVTGFQTNIFDPPDVHNKRCFELLKAFKNNFSLFYVYIDNDERYVCDDDDDYPDMDETVVAKISWYQYCTVVLDQLSKNSMEEIEKRRRLSLEHKELGKIYNACALVKTLPNTSWSTFLYKVKDCDTKYQNQAIHQRLNCGMLDTIGTCKTNTNDNHPCTRHHLMCHFCFFCSTPHDLLS